MDIYQILEAMKFAGEPEQKAGDQVRGTEKAKPTKSGAHPFKGRLVGASESVEQECDAPMTLADKLKARWEQTKREKGLQEYGMTTGGTAGMTTGNMASTDNATQTASDLDQTTKSLSALKSKVPGINVAKAAAALTKADTNQTLSNAEKDAGLELAPAVTDIIKDPQLAGQFKQLIDKSQIADKARQQKAQGGTV